MGDHGSLQFFFLGRVVCLWKMGNHGSLQLLCTRAMLSTRGDHDSIELLLLRVLPSSKRAIMALY